MELPGDAEPRERLGRGRPARVHRLPDLVLALDEQRPETRRGDGLRRDEAGRPASDNDRVDHGEDASALGNARVALLREVVGLPAEMGASRLASTRFERLGSTVLSTVAAVAAGVVLVLAPAANAGRHATLSLTVTFTANGVVTVTLPDGTPVGSTGGAPTVIPAGYYTLSASTCRCSR
jgi:hypothetical protein